MARIAPFIIRRYLFGGQVSSRGCLKLRQHRSEREGVLKLQRRKEARCLHTDTDPASPDVTIPFRKQLKDEAKRRKAGGGSNKSASRNQKLDEWELSVGIEIHAQLNTEKKLFSLAKSTISDPPNTRVALFDLAVPGTQPVFQKATLIPALRAALALKCDIQKISRFDRKHYFHWDQPAGYQITQYYQPFAKDGYITLYPHDGIAKEDGEGVRIGIKQIQMEQDTAKTISELGDIHLLDFNRVGLPLIEIITLPQIHHPATAAALVRKVQSLLNAVDACVLGMQSGGLRADVNVSVRRRGEEGTQQYSGVSGLGQRTEIKNLSSFKAVEDAIIAERDRQIEALEAGGVIEGETRGWTIGSTETRRLRGKEGEVDYRYMPDPDLGPVIIGADLLEHLKDNLPVLPDHEIKVLVNKHGLTIKDAMSIISLNDGGRVEYFYKVTSAFLALRGTQEVQEAGRICGNWVLHELGGLVSDFPEGDDALCITSDGNCIIAPEELASLIHYLTARKITGKTAKKLLTKLFHERRNGVETPVKEMIDVEGLWYTPLTDAEYEKLARDVLDVKIVQEILAGKEGKINLLLGAIMRGDEDGNVDPQEAMRVLRRVVEGFRK